MRGTLSDEESENYSGNICMIEISEAVALATCFLAGQVSSLVPKQ